MDANGRQRTVLGAHCGVQRATKAGATKARLTFMVEAEITARDQSNTRTRRRLAGFPVTNTLDTFDVAASSIPPATINLTALVVKRGASPESAMQRLEVLDTLDWSRDLAGVNGGAGRCREAAIPLELDWPELGESVALQLATGSAESGIRGERLRSSPIGHRPQRDQPTSKAAIRTPRTPEPPWCPGLAPLAQGVCGEDLGMGGMWLAKPFPLQGSITSKCSSYREDR